MQTRRFIFTLVALFGLGIWGMFITGIPAAAQIDPTSQQQTVNAAVAQHLDATATAQAASASTATANYEATLMESSIQTAVGESVRATELATLEAIGIDIRPVTANADWTPIEQDFDGVSMVFVPMGCFEMGSAEGDSDEQPVHQQCVDAPFWLDKTEVTQAQFTVNQGVVALPSYFSGDNRPVEQITWFEARDYCQSRGGRLPTEAEWEYAARGPDGLTYPWGNEFIPDNLVYEENSNDETAEVGSRPSGVSWVGALDMSGNVWEWMSSLYRDYPYDAGDGREDLTAPGARALRGGSWNDVDNVTRAAKRYAFMSPDVDSFRIGFRCARSS